MKSFEKTKATILIVEDDMFNVEYLTELLSETNHIILHTAYGKKAVDISTTQDIDIVLMDIRLPDIDGYEATRQIKRQKPKLKIVAQTAYAAPADRQKALDAGCDEYISKPIAKDKFFELLNRVMFLTQ